MKHSLPILALLLAFPGAIQAQTDPGRCEAAWAAYRELSARSVMEASQYPLTAEGAAVREACGKDALPVPPGADAYRLRASRPDAPPDTPDQPPADPPPADPTLPASGVPGPIGPATSTAGGGTSGNGTSGNGASGNGASGNGNAGGGTSGTSAPGVAAPPGRAPGRIGAGS